MYRSKYSTRSGLGPTRLISPRSTFQSSGSSSKLVVDEIALVGSRCGPFAPALRLLATGQVDVAPLVHDRFALDEGLVAFARARERGCLKVLLDMGAGT